MIVVMVMAVAVAVVLFVGATLGIKRRLDRLKPRTKAAQHIFDHMIAPDAQPLTDQLHVDVTIADMPGEPREIVGIRRGDFNKRLRPANHADYRAVVEHEAVAVTKRRGVRQIKQEFCAALTAEHHPPAMALIRIELDRVDRVCLIPMSCRFNGARVLHG